MKYVTSCCGRPIEQCPGCPTNTVLIPSRPAKKHIKEQYNALGHYCRIILESSVLNNILQQYSNEDNFSEFVKSVHRSTGLPHNAKFRPVTFGDAFTIINYLRGYSESSDNEQDIIGYLIAVGENGIAVCVGGLPREGTYRNTSTSFLILKFRDGQIIDGEAYLTPPAGSSEDREDLADFLRHLGDINIMYLTSIAKSELSNEKNKQQNITPDEAMLIRLQPLLYKVITQLLADLNGRIKMLIDNGSYRHLDSYLHTSRRLHFILRRFKKFRLDKSKDPKEFSQFVQNDHDLRVAMQKAVNSTTEHFGSYEETIEKLKTNDPKTISAVLYFFKMSLLE